MAMVCWRRTYPSPSFFSGLTDRTGIPLVFRTAIIWLIWVVTQRPSAIISWRGVVLLRDDQSNAALETITLVYNTKILVNCSKTINSRSLELLFFPAQISS